MDNEQADDIEYDYVEHGTQKSGVWRGDRRVAVEAGESYLDPALLWSGDYVYRASNAEGGGFYAVTADDVAALGAGILARGGASEVYSIWRTGCGREATDEEVAEGGDQAGAA